MIANHDRAESAAAGPPAGGHAAVHVAGLRKRYGDVNALADVDLRARQIPLTRDAISHLFAALIIEPVQDAWHRLRWSTWRHRARTCHYQRQARQL